MKKHLFMSLPVLFIATIVLSVGVSAATPPFTTIGGKLGPGARYEIAMPTVPWNGELVVFAHGIVSPNQPIALPDIGPWRDTLTSQGFAMIYSSYSENSYAVKDGMQRTHQLRGIFKSKIGQPRRVYLVGVSMGGLIAVMLAERYPGQYDGVLTAGGLVGGAPYETKYLVDSRILFDYFFPGVIPGTAWYVPPDIDFSKVFDDVLQALLQGLDPALGSPTLQYAATANLPGNDVGEIITAGLYHIGFILEFAGSVLEFTNGHMPYDNTKTVYAGSADDAALNAGVERYAADPSAAEYWQHYYTPTGDLHIPVITLHATRDPISPIHCEDMFADAVAHAGASEYLLQRQFDTFGHTGTSDDDVAAAFFALVEWVHSGVKPLN